MPAALLAFTAAMLLVGLRALTNRGVGEAHERTDAMTSAARGAPASEVGLPSSPAAAATPDGQASPNAPETTTTTAAPLGSATATASATVAAPTPRAPQYWAPARTVHAPPPVVTQAPAAPAAAPAPPTNAPAAPAHKAGCENPFMVGTDGIRQIKPECM